MNVIVLFHVFYSKFLFVPIVMQIIYFRVLANCCCFNCVLCAKCIQRLSSILVDLAVTVACVERSFLADFPPNCCTKRGFLCVKGL